MSVWSAILDGRDEHEEPVETQAEDQAAWLQRLRRTRARARALERVKDGLSGLAALRGEPETATEVRVDLDAERLEVRCEEGVIGSWPLDGLVISREVQGFKLSVEGEELLLVTEDDVTVALGLGLDLTEES